MIEGSLIPLTDKLAIKANVQGMFIYMTMLVYVLALFLYLCQLRKAGWQMYFSGFAISLVSVVFRWWHVEHIPLQNMFEVFLVLGTCPYLISLLGRRYLQVGGECGDIVLGVVFLFPAGLVFSDVPQQLPPALQSPLFGPHVLAYMLAYFIMAKAAVQGFLSVCQFGSQARHKMVQYEAGAYRLVSLGFPLLTLGLILGSIWGKQAWGDYWNWDPKELWSLASWLVYLLFFHWRTSYGISVIRINSMLVMLGFIFIIITLLWVNLSRFFPGLHSYA